MLVDSLIIGDSPYALAVQNALREMGESTCLVYTGELGVRYIYAEDVDCPHVVCTYKFDESSVFSPLQTLQYQQAFRRRAGGDFQFVYSVISHFGEPAIPLRISAVSGERLRQRGIIIGDPSTVALINKFVRIDSRTIHFGRLVVEESLAKFLQRVDIDMPLLRRNIGVYLEESVPLLPARIRVTSVDGGETPLFSVSRGFLWYHYYPEGVGKANFTLQNYIRIPSAATIDLSGTLEDRSVFLVGPRALWNTGLTYESETLRLRELIGVPTR